MIWVPGDVHHSLHCNHRVDEVKGHGHVVEDLPTGGVVAGGEAGAGEPGVLRVAGDVVPAALAGPGLAAVPAGAPGVGLSAGLDLGDLLPLRPPTVGHSLGPEQDSPVLGGQTSHALPLLLHLPLPPPEPGEGRGDHLPGVRLPALVRD